MRAASAVLAGGVVLLLAVSAQARTLRQSSGPAEVPPASYKANQYVDSKGCAFVRAGFGGNVQWVPRVTRSRQMICGQTPTAVAGTTKPQKTRTVQSQPGALIPQSTTVASATPPAAARPKQNTFNWNWFGQPKQKTAPRTQPVQQPQQKTTYGTPRTQPAPQPAAAPRRVAVATAFDPYSSSHPIRRTPQAIHPADYVNGRLGHRQSGQQVQVTRSEPYAVPEGYKSLLDSGAPAPRRGVGTPQGQAQMDLIWTQTTPRRLIDTYTGQDVTAQNPQIRYPYTTASTRAYSATSATLVAPVNATPRKKRRTGTRDAASPANMKNISDVSALTAEPIQQKPAPVAAAVSKPAPASHRFVQVATFGVPANASRTVSKFNAGGLPTATRALKRRGKTYAIVLLGPFNDDASLKAALANARNAGFSDAFALR